MYTRLGLFSAGRLKTVANRTRQTALRLCLECEAKGVNLQYVGASDSATPQERKGLDGRADG